MSQAGDNGDDRDLIVPAPAAGAEACTQESTEMRQQAAHKRKLRPLVGVVAGTILSAAQAYADQGAAKPAPIPAAVPAVGQQAPFVRKASPYRPVSVTPSAKTYYQSVWGVDNFLVRRTASGNLIRFSYRVTNPARAKPLGDKTATPYLIGLRSRAVLQIPVMEQVGALRQTGTPEAGKEFWMVFSNKGDLVKAGDRVNVIIGSFHADGLMVE
jgi:hypothetical protein